MANDGVRQLAYLLQQAFDGDRQHSFLSNLSAVPPSDWRRAPPGGTRTVADIVGHVGWCYFMYWNYAFGDCQLKGNSPLVEPACLRDFCPGNVPSVLAWLRGGHRRFQSAVSQLDDSELVAPRMTNWGEPAETRWIISEIIEHDLYHAGEINHLRAVLQGDDRWPYDAA